MFDRFFKREVDPAEQAKLWRRKLNSEMRKIDTQIRKIQREELKVKTEAKVAARKGDAVVVRMLAKEIIRARNAVKRMYTARTQMSSVAMHLQQQASQIKLVGSVSKSTEIMTQMNRLMHIREVQDTMREMSKEMMKSGLIEEIISDTIDDALDDDISNTELDEEVNKVIEEVTQNKMQGASVGYTKLPQVQQQEMGNEEAEDVDEDELLSRLNALRSGS